MFRSRTMKASVLGALALGLVLLIPGTSEAQRRGGGGGRGGGGNYQGGYSGSRYGGWGGVGISIGTPYYGGYGYGRPFYGSNYGGYGYGYPYTYSNNYYYDTPTYYSQPSYATSVPQTSFYSGNMTNPNTAGFTVRVPDPNAEVWFQNYRTQQNGTVRHFQSEALDPSSTYTFQVRVRWMQNGQMMDQTRQVPARAGQNYMVDFSSEAVPTAPINRSTSLEPFSQ